jgi:Phosphotransferase enzyme family
MRGAPLPWEAPGWLGRATSWIDERVERTGELELVRALPWAATARVPTADGPVWFKESAPGLAFEPALTVIVSSRRPDCTPTVVGAEGARLVTRDCGVSLHDAHEAGSDPPGWDRVLPLYAELQIALTADADDALAAGTPDKRPAGLRELAAGLDLEEELSAAVERALEGLGDDVPATVAHEEIHEGNVFVRDGRPFFLDWGEACVSHPFVAPLLALRAATERAGLEPGSAEVEGLRDAYLEPFTSFAPAAELRESFACGYLLAALCRALTWRRILDPLSPSVREELGDPSARWLAILRDVASGASRLGGA